MKPVCMSVESLLNVCVHGPHRGNGGPSPPTQVTVAPQDREYSAPQDRKCPSLSDPRSHGEVGLKAFVREVLESMHREGEPVPGLTNRTLRLPGDLAEGKQTH